LRPHLFANIQGEMRSIMLMRIRLLTHENHLNVSTFRLINKLPN